MSRAHSFAGGGTACGRFGSTRWTLVAASGQRHTPQGARALAELCRVYWYPLYAHVRRRGHAPHEAQDLTQAFFARLLEKEGLTRARPARGRFRSFLLASLNHFLADEWDKACAQKRGAGQVFSLDGMSAESRHASEPRDAAPPDKMYERQWALQLLDLTLGRLQAEFAAAGHEVLFEQLRFSLAGERSAVPYAELAARLDMTAGAVKVAVHRLRQRYRAILHEEIAQTVASEAEVEDELRCLFKALAR